MFLNVALSSCCVQVHCKSAGLNSKWEDLNTVGISIVLTLVQQVYRLDVTLTCWIISPRLTVCLLEQAH